MSIGEEKKVVRVMIVDDYMALAESLKYHLILEGFEVEIFDEAPKALIEFKRKDYDVVLLDLKMPEMTGEEMLRRMREYGWGIPVIILTAYPVRMSNVKDLQLGPFDVIQKPFRISQVVEGINRAIRKREVVTHPKELPVSEVPLKHMTSRRGRESSYGNERKAGI